MHEAEPADDFFVIRGSGDVALETFVPQRGALTIETLHDGDLLGWSWLVPPYRTMFDARPGADPHGVIRRRVSARQVRGRPRARL